MVSTDVKLSPDFALVFRALPGLYLLLSTELNILDCTELYSRTSNFRIEEAIGKYILDTFPDNPEKSDEAAKQELISSLHYVLKNKQPHTMPVVRFDVPLAAPQGGFDRRYWSTTHTPILNAAGDIVYILHETRDITATVLQEQLYEQNLERLTLLANKVNAVTWSYDAAKKQVNWGSNLKQVLGYEPNEMGTDENVWRSRVHPDNYETTLQSFEEALKNHTKLWEGEYRLRKADGSYAHILDQRYFIYDPEGNLLRIIGSLIDVSKSREAELAAKESDARFKHLLEALPFMAWIASPNGNIQSFNKAWHSFTGMPPGQVEGWVSYVHPDDTARVLTTWHESIRSGCPFELEYRLQNKLENRYEWFLERGVPLYDSTGNIKIWLGSYTDAREQSDSWGNYNLPPI
ncbi:PAS domain-containing protein [Pontibacter sp. Tf4]|uniref:PAS domain-containing protein n=1 Tax=Pontibacter sp. Tf4 TaxID=2761620 RepID=UPI0016232180|nr:PAS domain-containing protein [Pontibacter sp. Tf4]MBB6609924.1 PAS domain-containing protein [Pontibacter sp. Tf4]